MWLYVSPFVKSTIYAWVANAFQVCVCLAAIIDGTRKGIPRLKVRAWAAFCLLALGIPFSLALFVRQFLFQPFAMPSHSMEPMLMGDHKAPAGTGQGDRIFVNKWSYRFKPPKRGDIAVFRTAGIERSRRELFRIPEGQYYIKRVVGLPGERISIAHRTFTLMDENCWSQKFSKRSPAPRTAIKGSRTRGVSG